MSAIRFFTDEDVYGTTAAGLRAAGFDAVSAPEAGRLGESDESQLEWARQSGRTLFTFNVAHFAGYFGQPLRRLVAVGRVNIGFFKAWLGRSMVT